MLNRIGHSTEREMLPIRKVKFERASSSSLEKPQEISPVKPARNSITGKEAQEFYERVISNPSAKRKKKVKTEKRNLVEDIERGNNQKRLDGNHKDVQILFRFAQEGKLKQIKKLFLDQNVCDINAVDSFGWTALMCAACAGHPAVVRYLLQKGANKELTNRNGQTAYDLAKAKKVTNVMKILQSWNEESGHEWLPSQDANVVQKKTRNKFFCVACARYFTDTSLSSHQTSTVHLFNSKPKQRGTWYHINESNKGFRMLLKDGWDKEKGLGPEGKEGLKFPVKTILKRDRKCLGSVKTDNSTPRVTHFKPYDLSAVKKPRVETGKVNLKREQSESKTNKRKLEKKRRKEKEWEIDFRRSFSLE